MDHLFKEIQELIASNSNRIQGRLSLKKINEREWLTICSGGNNGYPNDNRAPYNGGNTFNAEEKENAH